MKEKSLNYYFYIVPQDRKDMMHILRELLDAGIWISGEETCDEKTLLNYCWGSDDTRFYIITVDIKRNSTNGFNTISEAKRGGEYGEKSQLHKKIKIEDLLKILPDYGIKRRYSIKPTNQPYPYGH